MFSFVFSPALHYCIMALLVIMARLSGGLKVKGSKVCTQTTREGLPPTQSYLLGVYRVFRVFVDNALHIPQLRDKVADRGHHVLPEVRTGPGDFGAWREKETLQNIA